MNEGKVWDERYRTMAAGWPSHPDPDLEQLAGAMAPGRAIDLGCGTGRNALWLAAQGWDVTGVDGSEVGLAHARRAAAELGLDVDWVLADLSSFDYPAATADLVVLANIHTDPAELPVVYGAAAASVAPGGRFFVVGHHADVLGRGMGGPPDPDRLFTVERLQAAVPGVVWERLERVERTGASGAAAPATTAPAAGTAVTDIVVVGWGQPATS